MIKIVEEVCNISAWDKIVSKRKDYRAVARSEPNVKPIIFIDREDVKCKVTKSVSFIPHVNDLFPTRSLNYVPHNPEFIFIDNSDSGRESVKELQSLLF